MSGQFKILIVAGARPNFVKIAPLMREFGKAKAKFSVKLVHTGQHYDFKMSGIFFKNLNIPKPDIFLDVGSASHAEQTARIMIAFEKVALKERPGLIIVVGDVNSTLACTVVAAKLNIRIAHVEAGLRSFDRAMPEEINRIVTDSLSDYLFVSEKSGLVNLRKEGVPGNKIFFVGNVMMDTLKANLSQVKQSKIIKALNLSLGRFCLVTLHRPSNVDSPDALMEIWHILESVQKKLKVVYPIHPRTKKMIESHGILPKFLALENLLLCDPLGYIDFIRLVKDAKLVLTDSGGIQEETTYLKVPCLTMRDNTERPVTTDIGTNVLVGRDRAKIVRLVSQIVTGRWKTGKVPEKWDGKSAARIVKALEKLCGS